MSRNHLTNDKNRRKAIVTDIFGGGRHARILGAALVSVVGFALQARALVLPQDLRSEAVNGVTWSYAIEDGKAKVTNWNMHPAIDVLTKGAVVVPAMLGGCPVTAIGAYAFYQMTGITSLEIPEGVEIIEYYACRGCTGLESVSLPSTLTSMENGIFTGCTKLKAGFIPDSVTSMGRDTFWGCQSMTSVKFSANVTSLDTMTCYNCDSLTNAVIPEGVTCIGVSAFLNCDNLRSVRIPTTVTNIGNYAFNDCVSLEALNLPTGLTSITDCFSGCTSLTNVTVPASVVTIAAETFRGCTSMTAIEVEAGNSAYKSVDGILYDITGTVLIAWPYGRLPVVIPSGVKRIGDSVFAGRRDIVSVILPEGLESIGASAFDMCGNLAIVDFPSTLKTIGFRAFYNCNALSSATFSEGFQSIGEKAFWNTGVQSLVFPSSTTLIDQYAFYGCRQLRSLEVKSPLCRIEDYAFLDCTQLTSISIASGASVSAYAFAHPEQEDDPPDSIVIKTYSDDLTTTEIKKLKDIVGQDALRDVKEIRLVPDEGEEDDAPLTCIQLGISPTYMKTTKSILELRFTNPTVEITGLDLAARVIMGRIVPAEESEVVQPPMKYMFGLNQIDGLGSGSQVIEEWGDSISLETHGFALDLSDYVRSNGVFSISFPKILLRDTSAFFSISIKPYVGRTK